MTIHQILLAYMLENVPSRNTLADRLQTDRSQVSCYYICALSILKDIIIDGFRCRIDSTIKIDLSSSDVQSLRESVWLGKSASVNVINKKPNTPIHACINFFWNPVNRTLEAFERNGMLYAEETKKYEHGIICIVEVDMQKLLSTENVFWTITNKNAASNAFNTFEKKFYQNYPWSQIFALGSYTQNYPHQERAAEVIVFVNKPGSDFSQPVPSSVISRIFLPQKIEGKLDIDSYLGKSNIALIYSDVFKEPSDLFRAERLFLYNMSHYKTADCTIIERIVKTFILTIKLEKMFGGPTSDRFLNKKMADRNHGIGHTARVIFWSLFLATYCYGMNLNLWHQIIYLSALIHDLARLKDYDTEDHGERAIATYRKEIEGFISDSSKLESCFNAVQMHSLSDDLCPIEKQDIVWNILKDSDGLDRGRFAKPDNANGCNPQMLRLKYLPNKESFRERGPWMAYQLAGMTKLIRWDEMPCKRLALNFYYGISAGFNNNVYWGESKVIAQELLNMMEEQCKIS